MHNKLYNLKNSLEFDNYEGSFTYIDTKKSIKEIISDRGNFDLKYYESWENTSVEIGKIGNLIIFEFGYRYFFIDIKYIPNKILEKKELFEIRSCGAIIAKGDIYLLLCIEEALEGMKNYKYFDKWISQWTVEKTKRMLNAFKNGESLEELSRKIYLDHNIKDIF